MSKKREILEVSSKLFERRKLVDKKGNTKGFVLVVISADGDKHDVWTFPTRFELEDAQRVLTEAFLTYSPEDL